MRVILKFIGLNFCVALAGACNNSTENKKTVALSTDSTGTFLPSNQHFDNTIKGKAVSLFYLKNKNSVQAAITNYGARAVSLRVPDKSSKLTAIIIGLDNLSKFISAGEPFFGTVAGRHGNRIAKGRFSFDGQQYQLDLNNGANTQLKYGKGYDHNFVLDEGITTAPELVYTVTGDLSGITMEILTTGPGLQFYGGNFMKSANALKQGTKDDYRTAFCLETQHFPDSPDQPSFPTTVIEPG